MRIHSVVIKLLTSILLLFISLNVHSQDSSSLFNRILSFPDKVFGRIDKEANKYEQKLIQQTDKYLNKLQRQEEKLKRKLWKQDSAKAKEVFGDVQGRYDQLRNQLHAPPNEVQQHTAGYNGHLDSLGTAMNFLQSNPQLQQATELKNKLTGNLQSINDLKSKLNQTDHIRKQIVHRQQELKNKLQNTALLKEFQKYKKQVYYFQAQAREYHQAIKDPKKLGASLMTVAKKIPAFNDFFRKNSELASLFRIPGGNDPANSMASFAGLQTRASVQNILQQRIGTGANAQQYVQDQMQSAQGQMQELKNKALQYKSGSYGNGDGDMPDFKVNEQKTKNFLQRIEWGSNMQTTKGNLYFPVTSDLGVSIGYKGSESLTFGVGASYKIGFGKSWQNISVTHQGAGLRTFLDIKLKGSFWISGGGELNYRNEFRRIEVLKNMNAWQQSALLGISRKFKAGKKMKGSTQLLYDFLWKQQVPRSQMIVFRVGYQIN
jgi:hypothetical protein